MALSKKSLTDLEKLISDMSPEQWREHYIDITEKLLPELNKQELESARNRFDALLEAAKEAEREKFMVEAREWAERAKQLGLNLGEAIGISPPVRERVRLAASTNGSNSGERARPKAKYRDPLTGKEWSGRGRPAAFITEAIASGRIKDKDEFLIKE